MKLKHIWMICGLISLTSCFKDETTHATGAISEIFIEEGEASIEAVYNIDKDETRTISPKITQSHVEKPLSYTWEIGDEVYARTPELVFVGNMLGTFQCRLVVENEDGKAFFPFVIHVNSPYEEGITVLSCDKNGKSMLSFMLKQHKEGIADYFEEGDCFSFNNPEEPFASNVADMVQCDGSLIVACRGGGTPEDPGKIYYLNEKTFLVENHLSTAEYPDFKPTKMGIPANGSVGVAYPILCENGKVYEFSTAEGTLIPASKLNYTYEQALSVYNGGFAGKYALYFWDKEIKALTQIMNGYGPYICTPKYLDRESIERTGNDTKNYFNGYDLVSMVMTSVEKGSEEDPELIVIVKNKSTYQKVRLYGPTLWRQSEELGEAILIDNGGMKKAGYSSTRPSKWTMESPVVAPQKYQTVLFGDGNKVYQWSYTISQDLDKAKVHYEITDKENAVITGLCLSEDLSETFVAFYEDGKDGLNGSVRVIDTDTGKEKRRYDNICYKPVKIMYKKK